MEELKKKYGTSPALQPGANEALQRARCESGGRMPATRVADAAAHRAVQLAAPARLRPDRRRGTSAPACRTTWSRASATRSSATRSCRTVRSTRPRIGSVDLARPAAPDPFFILPVLAGLVQLIASVMAMPAKQAKSDDPAQRMTQSMAYTFPLITVVIGAQFPPA